jgi:hypothetical protein
VRLNIRPPKVDDMQLISEDSRRYLLLQRLARRWIQEGGVVIAAASARAGERSTFDFAETIASGATLQVTFNLREVSKACKFLSDYAVYLWNCDHEGEFVLCGIAENGTYGFDTPFDAGSARPYRRVPATCYAGRFPKLRLDIYDAKICRPTVSRAALMTRMLLPRGLCAAVYQNLPGNAPAKRLDQVDERSPAGSICGGMASLRAPFPGTPQTAAQDV